MGGWFLGLLVVAVGLWALAEWLRRRSGLPLGEVVYRDTGGWGRVERPLFSARLQLTGKPDYLVREGRALVPVEVKSGQAPAAGAHPAHIYQLAAYCALVAEAYGERPGYGLIKYADRVFKVPYTAGLERELFALLDDMHLDRQAETVGRSHTAAARCRACGLRPVCDERLI